MASQWKTFQRFAENLVFGEAPKFIRQLQRSENLQSAIKTGIDAGLSALAGTAANNTRALTAGRPVTKDSAPTAQRARKLVYAPDLDGRADPGEIVWTWVVYEDDPTSGKDRPVLVVGRDRRTLLGLMLSSQDRHHADRELGQHRQRQLGLRGAHQLGAAGPGPRRARGGHPPRGRDPGPRPVRAGRDPAARRVLLELTARTGFARV